MIRGVLSEALSRPAETLLDALALVLLIAVGLALCVMAWAVLPW